ncbi:MAG: glycosyltransferase family 9 protein [Elusimicrobiaceae bacterium]|nr:glycosyltransferase family 9 protein [Elusimicrobiaceae bacterium]
MIKDIGDVVLTTPMAEVLHANYPEAKIDLLASSVCAPVAKNNPFINETIIYDKKAPLKMILEIRKRKYDWVLDFLSNPRSAILTFFSGAKLKAGNERGAHAFYAYNFKFKYPKGPFYSADVKLNFVKQLGVTWPTDHAPLAKYYFDEGYQNKAKELYKTVGLDCDKEFLFAFSPFATNPLRELSPKFYKELALLISKEYPKAKIITTATPQQSDKLKEFLKIMPSNVLAAPETKTLEDLMIVFSKVQVQIGPCGGAKHMALASGARTVAFNNLVSGSGWTPNSPRHKYIQARVKCSPCASSCRKMSCQKSVTPEMFLEAIKEVLKY